MAAVGRTTRGPPPPYQGGTGMSDYEIIMILLTVLGFLMAVVKLFKK